MMSWSEIVHDFGHYWFIYLSMPLVAAFVGWSTKIVAMEMIYRPEKFVGIGPIGWQGIIPRRAGKVGSKTMELFTENLLKPEELLERIDADEAVVALQEPISNAIDKVARDVAEQVRPGVWDALPDAGRRAIVGRIQSQVPRVTAKMLEEMKADLPRFIDLQYLAITTLVRNKSKLNRLLRGVSADAMAFIRRAGIYFGLGIGLVQMIVWALFKNPWIMPAFGFGIGLVSDWLALNMLFRPIHRRPYFRGLFQFQGMLHAQRDKITRDYARLLATDLFAPDMLIDSILRGPGADRLFALIAREVNNAIDEETGIGGSVLKFAVGTTRYQALKDGIVTMVLDELPNTLAAAEEYTLNVIDLENTIVEKMNQLTPEEYESILRPIFKDDEPLMISLGAVLGGLVGELQVQIIELLTHH